MLVGFEKSGHDCPVPRIKHACEGAKTPNLGFQNQLITRDGFASSLITYSTVSESEH